jgi:hypothetical protein
MKEELLEKTPAPVEKELTLKELDPTAVLVLLSQYYKLIYLQTKELPIQIPFQLKRHGKHYSARADTRTRTIILGIRDIKTDSYTEQVFQPEQFESIFIHAIV